MDPWANAEAGNKAHIGNGRPGVWFRVTRKERLLFGPLKEPGTRRVRDHVFSSGSRVFVSRACRVRTQGGWNLRSKHKETKKRSDYPLFFSRESDLVGPCLAPEVRTPQTQCETWTRSPGPQESCLVQLYPFTGSPMAFVIS